jgi:hypothetical protein
MLTTAGEMRRGTADSMLDRIEKTLPSSDLGTSFEIMERMTMEGVELRIEMPAPGVEVVVRCRLTIMTVLFKWPFFNPNFQKTCNK